MLNYHAPLDLAFQALADPTRRAIVERLNEEGTVVTLQNGSATHPGDALQHNGHTPAHLTG